MAVAGPVGPTQLDPRIEEELRKRSALAATGMKEIKGSEQKLSVIKEAKLNLNPHNQKYLENFEKNVDKIKVYESNDKKMAVLVDLENQRLMEMTFMGPKKTNVERWEVKKEAQPAQVTQIIPVKDLSSQISWDMGEKAKLSSQQEVKLKESLTASATASQIKEPLPAIIEPKELDAKPMPKVSNDNCLKAATSLIDEISKSVEKLQGRMESEFQSKQKGVLSQSGVESVRVLLGVPGAKLTTFEAYRSDMNDKRVGLTYVKSLLGKGKTIESMQKMTVKDFKDEKEFGKFSNGLKFLGSNLKDKNRIYNYLGDINSHLNFFDDAMDFYAKGGNKESL